MQERSVFEKQTGSIDTLINNSTKLYNNVLYYFAYLLFSLDPCHVTSQIKAIVSNSAIPSKPFVAVAEMGSTQYSVCDREQHSLKVIMQNTGLAIEADSKLQGFQFNSEANFVADLIYRQQLYLGILG